MKPSSPLETVARDLATPSPAGLGASFQSPSGADGAAETSTYVEETFRFLNAPPLWVLALIVLPATVAFAYSPPTVFSP